jgi:hypothetical protein
MRGRGIHLLPHVPQERFLNSVVLYAVEERVDLEVFAELLGECDMAFVVKAGPTKDENGIFVLQLD